MTIRKATPSSSKFNKKNYVPNGAGKPHIQTARELFAADKDKPTTAAGDPSLRLPEVLKQVDPKMLSQVLPEMYNKLNSVRNLMNAFNSKGGGGSNAQTPEGYSKLVITDVFTGALCILCNELSYNRVLTVLFDALDDNKYKNIAEEYQDIVFEAIVKIIQLAEEHGEDNLPVSTIPEINTTSDIPTNVISYDAIPDYSTRQYYRTELDPYPAYVEYVDTDGTSYYVRRTVTDYPFESAEKEVFTLAEYAFAEELALYIKENTTEPLTVNKLNILLVRYCTQILLDLTEKQNGKNSNNNLLSMLTQFAGLAATLTNSSISNHLPQSVLDQSSMQSTLQEHIKNIGKIKKMKEQAAGAFDLVSALTSQVSGVMRGSLGQKIQSVQSVVSSIKASIT